MKKKYVTPTTVVVNLNLIGSVLDTTAGVNNKASVYSTWELGDDAKKNHNFNEEEETPVGTVGGNKSVWDD